MEKHVGDYNNVPVFANATMGEPLLTKKVQDALTTVRANTAKWPEFDIIHAELMRLALRNANLETALDLRVELIEKLKDEVIRLRRPSAWRAFIDWMNQPLK